MQTLESVLALVMLSDSVTSLLFASKDFSTFSKSRAIRKDFTHTCKNDKKKGQNDKRARCFAYGGT